KILVDRRSVFRHGDNLIQRVDVHLYLLHSLSRTKPVRHYLLRNFKIPSAVLNVSARTVKVGWQSSAVGISELSPMNKPEIPYTCPFKSTTESSGLSPSLHVPDS